MEHKFEQAQNIFSTKEDLAKLELKISLQIAELKSETTKHIAETKSELIKWMFAFVLGSTVSIIAVILTVMKMGGW